MKHEINQEEPEIVLVSTVKLDVAPCTPSACTPNVPCNPNTSCNPFNCAPALKPCMPDCAPAPQCNPTQGPLPPKPGPCDPLRPYPPGPVPCYPR